MISVYIHWPFCKSKCPYCDFNSHVSKTIDYELWLMKYLKEIELYKDFLKNKTIKSIFFGGGTPSLMPIFIFEAIFKKLSNISQIDKLCEITCEVNPTSFENKKFLEFKNLGINRVSVGVQSFDDQNLRFLGRNHSSDEARSVLSNISKIFENYSFDLIYALPNQTIESLEKELNLAMTFQPRHISLYQLTIEEGTKFEIQYKNKAFELPNDDLANELFEYTNNFLEQNKYQRYEISNFAMQGYESIHNLNYWQYQSYIGIGPGAHGRIHNLDIKNSNTKNFNLINCANSNIVATAIIKDPNKWVNSNNFSNIIKFDILNQDNIVQEICLMNLRLKNGINIEYFNQITGFDLLNILSIRFLESMNKFYLNYFEFFFKNTGETKELSIFLNDIHLYDNRYDLHLRIKPKYIFITNYLISKLLEILNDKKKQKFELRY